MGNNSCIPNNKKGNDLADWLIDLSRHWQRDEIEESTSNNCRHIESIFAVSLNHIPG